MHEASSATALLRQIGRAPSVRIVTYGAEGAGSCAQEIGVMLSAMSADPRYDTATIDLRMLEPTSACALAGKLADVLNRCVA
jgi:hypothetical protein